MSSFANFSNFAPPPRRKSYLEMAKEALASLEKESLRESLGEESKKQPRSEESEGSERSNCRAAIAQALVADFAQHGHVHEVRVPGVPDTLFIVPTPAEGERLAREGIARGRIWLPQELADLLTAGLSPTDFAGVALAKLTFGAEVLEVRRR